MAYEQLVFRVHAIQRMFQRQISDQDLFQALKSGEVIEDYPEDTPYPSKLILGWSGSRPIHIVAADNHEESETIIITVYQPDLDQWEHDFKRRKIS